VIRYPPLVRAGRRDDRFVLNVDLAPTFAALAGVTPGLPQDGRDLGPILDDTATSWRTDVLGEHWGIRLPTYALVQDARWKYVEYFGGATELYDLETDRWEIGSLANDPAQASRIATMASRLRELVPGWPPAFVLPKRGFKPAPGLPPPRKVPGTPPPKPPPPDRHQSR
jgi:arylsulfatase A-like enzyme